MRTIFLLLTTGICCRLIAAVLQHLFPALRDAESTTPMLTVLLVLTVMPLLLGTQEDREEQKRHEESARRLDEIYDRITKENAKSSK